MSNINLYVLLAKLRKLDADMATKGVWMGQTESHMLKVQSMRLRFGQLTSKMQQSLGKYEILLNEFSGNEKLPLEFRTKLESPKTALLEVQVKFKKSFSPEKYIEDSVLMYITTQKVNISL